MIECPLPVNEYRTCLWQESDPSGLEIEPEQPDSAQALLNKSDNSGSPLPYMPLQIYRDNDFLILEADLRADPARSRLMVNGQSVAWTSKIEMSQERLVIGYEIVDKSGTVLESCEQVFCQDMNPPQIILDQPDPGQLIRIEDSLTLSWQIIDESLMFQEVYLDGALLGNISQITLNSENRELLIRAQDRAGNLSERRFEILKAGRVVLAPEYQNGSVNFVLDGDISEFQAGFENENGFQEIELNPGCCSIQPPVGFSGNFVLKKRDGSLNLSVKIEETAALEQPVFNDVQLPEKALDQTSFKTGQEFEQIEKPVLPENIEQLKTAEKTATEVYHPKEKPVFSLYRNGKPISSDSVQFMFLDDEVEVSIEKGSLVSLNYHLENNDESVKTLKEALAAGGDRPVRLVAKAQDEAGRISSCQWTIQGLQPLDMSFPDRSGMSLFHVEGLRKDGISISEDRLSANGIMLFAHGELLEKSPVCAGDEIRIYPNTDQKIKVFQNGEEIEVQTCTDETDLSYIPVMAKPGENTIVIRDLNGGLIHEEKTSASPVPKAAKPLLMTSFSGLFAGFGLSLRRRFHA